MKFGRYIKRMQIYITIGTYILSSAYMIIIIHGNYRVGDRYLWLIHIYCLQLVAYKYIYNIL